MFLAVYLGDRLVINIAIYQMRVCVCVCMHLYTYL